MTATRVRNPLAGSYPVLVPSIEAQDHSLLDSPGTGTTTGGIMGKALQTVTTGLAIWIIVGGA